MKICDRIRTARERADISLREMARRADMSPSHLLRIESGDSQPSEEHLREICEHTDLDFDSVMTQMGRVPTEVQKFVLRTPGVLRQLRARMSAA